MGPPFLVQVGDTLTYHILPVEYLANLEPNGFSAESTCPGGLCWFGPPPLFSLSTLMDAETELAFSWVEYVVGRQGG